MLTSQPTLFRDQRLPGCRFFDRPRHPVLTPAEISEACLRTGTDLEAPMPLLRNSAGLVVA